MANDANKFLYSGDEIDLKEIFKILIESKKLIISTILFFTISSIIYSLSIKPSFLTSTNLEIGYIKLDNGDRKLIESSTDLIQDLNIQKIKDPVKFRHKFSVNSIYDKLIRLETTSNSAEYNEKFLTELVNYIFARHSSSVLLINSKKKDKVQLEIDLFESEISFRKDILRDDLETNISKLKSLLPIIDQEINQLNQLIIESTHTLNSLKGSTDLLEMYTLSQILEEQIFSYTSKINDLKKERNNTIADLNSSSKKLDDLKKKNFQFDDEIFNLSKKQKILEDQLKILMSETQINTHQFGDFKTIEIKPNIRFIVLLGITFGFIMSIILVIIINSVKSYRESQA